MPNSLSRRAALRKPCAELKGAGAKRAAKQHYREDGPFLIEHDREVPVPGSLKPFFILDTLQKRRKQHTRNQKKTHIVCSEVFKSAGEIFLSNKSELGGVQEGGFRNS